MKRQLTISLLLLLFHTAYSQPSSILQLRRQLARAPHDTVRIRLYGELAYLYNQQTIPDSAYYLALAGITLARRYRLPIAEGRLFMYLGNYYKRLAQYSKAREAFQTGLRLIKNTGPASTSLQCKLLYRLACVYGDEGTYQKTIEAASASRQLAEQLNDTALLFNAYDLLALAHMDMHNPSLALSYARKSYRLAKLQLAVHSSPLKWNNDLMVAEETLTQLYENNGQYARAYPYLKRMLNYFSSRHDALQTTNAAVRLSNNLVKQKRPLEALQLLNESLRTKLILCPVAATHEVYASAYQQLGQIDKALFHARRAYKLAVAQGHLKQIQSTLSTLMKLEESQKLYPEALAHMRQLTTINDSLFTIEKAKAIANVETRYRVNQQQNTIEILQKDATLRKLTLDQNQKELNAHRQQQLFLIVFALALIAVLAGLFVVFRRERATGRLLATQKAEIEDKANQLQQLNKLKDKLFAIIGHDLRSPIANLKTQLMGVQEGYSSPTQFIQRTTRLMQMVDGVYLTLDNLLNWAMLQRDSLQAHPSAFDLSEVTKSVVRLYQAELNQKQLHVSVHYEPAPVEADEHQLYIVVRNLLSNAIKFTPPGGTVRITTGHNQLTIQDSGVGMDLDTSQLLNGQPLSSRGTAGETGTGLGLEICRELVRLNNGRFAIQSRVNRGTTVTVTF